MWQIEHINELSIFWFQHNKILKILEEAGIDFVEPEYQAPRYKPGIDYDKPNRYAEGKKWKDDFQVSWSYLVSNVIKLFGIKINKY